MSAPLRPMVCREGMGLLMQTWVRRLISLGILFPSALLNCLLAPFLTGLFVLIDFATNRRLPLTRAYLLVSFYLLWEVIGVIAAFMVWLCLGPWRFGNHKRFLAWNYGLQRIWTNGFTRVGIALFSLDVTVEGNYEFGHTPFILLVRHTSLADTILVSWFLLVRHRIRARYGMKKELLWDPCLDIVGNRLPNYFIDRNSRNIANEVKGVAALAEGLGPSEGVVMYPEGTRFSEKKRARALLRLKEQGAEELLRSAERFQHVLPPRLAGTMALLEKAPNADAIFFAHRGFEGASSFAEIFSGSMIGREIRVRYWAVPAYSIPRDIEAQKRWIYQQWRQVDELVATWSVPTTP